jgi:hypothetical protein
MKIKFGIMLLMIIMLGGCFSSKYTVNSNEDVKDYIRDKYGFEINILREAQGGTGLNLPYLVQRVDEPKIEFSIFVKGWASTKITGDTYEKDLKHYELNAAYKKSSLYKTFLDLGYTKSHVQFSPEDNEQNLSLFLAKENGFLLNKDFAEFNNSLEKINKGLKELKNNGYHIHYMRISSVEHYDGYTIEDYEFDKKYNDIEFKNINEVLTTDYLNKEMNKTNNKKNALLNYYSTRDSIKVEEEKLKALNFKFFGSPSLECTRFPESIEISELDDSECLSYTFSLYRYQTIENFEESDINDIFELINYVRSLPLNMDNIQISAAGDDFSIVELDRYKDKEAVRTLIQSLKKSSAALPESTH